MSYSRILVPIDFSELSEPVLKRCASLATTLDASVTLLHVHEHIEAPPVDPAFRPLQPATEQEALVEALTRKLREQALAHELSGDRVAARVEIGDPLDLILGACGEHDLVLLATHGRRGIGQFLLGSITERVVRAAPCSVLVVRPTPS